MTDAAPCSATGFGDLIEDGPEVLAEGRVPEAFWSTTPELAAFRQLAQDQRNSPEALLHCVLARLAAHTRPSVRVLTGVGSPATLGWFCGLYGASGRGKGRTERTADQLAPVVAADLAWVDMSTGQGLIAAYTELREATQDLDPDDPYGDDRPAPKGRRERVPVQVRDRGFIQETEGSILKEMASSKTGSTLNQVLCKAWVSERQGTSNAERERCRSIGADTYTLSLSISVQPEPAQAVISMGAVGFPQRLAWAPAYRASTDVDIVHAPIDESEYDTYDDESEEDAAVITPLAVSVGGIPMGLTAWADTLRDIVVRLPRGAKEEIRRLVDEGETGRGESQPLDTHEPLWKAKCAALLALFHGGTQVTGAHWRGACALWDASRSMRQAVEHGTRVAEQVAKDARDGDAVQTAISVKAAVDGPDWMADKVARRIVRKVAEAGAEGVERSVMSRASVSSREAKAWRAAGEDGSLFVAALAWASDRGWLVVPEERGAVLTLGTVKP